MKFYKAGGHHDEIGRHLVCADELVERFDHAADLVGLVYQFVVCRRRAAGVPVPRVFERRDLRFAVAARFVAEQYVVIPIAVERRIKIDQIDRLVLDVVPQDLQIIAVVESVHGKSMPM